VLDEAALAKLKFQFADSSLYAIARRKLVFSAILLPIWRLAFILSLMQCVKKTQSKEQILYLNNPKACSDKKCVVLGAFI